MEITIPGVTGFDELDQIIVDAIRESIGLQPMIIDIDWADNSGMNRGDVIKIDGNITYVRFKAVELIDKN